jgi:hypothetical protein
MRFTAGEDTSVSYASFTLHFSSPYTLVLFLNHRCREWCISTRWGAIYRAPRLWGYCLWGLTGIGSSAPGRQYHQTIHERICTCTVCTLTPLGCDTNSICRYFRFLWQTDTTATRCSRPRIESVNMWALLAVSASDEREQYRHAACIVPHLTQVTQFLPLDSSVFFVPIFWLQPLIPEIRGRCIRNGRL